MNRRAILKSAMAGTVALAFPTLLRGQTNNIRILDGGGANVVEHSSADGIVLVDSGAPKSLAPIAKVHTLFNTHYHLDQTGNNELFAASGARIIAHERTHQWMSTDYWVPAEDRYEKARPKAALPTEKFLTTGSMRSGGEQIEYGYLPMAHTNGDIYVFFTNSNVLAVGDVASPQRDPGFDYFTGGWIGGRVDAMDMILKLANDQTRIVPSYGPIMTRAEFKAERDLMEEVRARLWKYVREGLGPKEMLDAGVMNGLARTWKDPYKFLYDAAKGMWAHHNKIDPNVV